MVLWTSPACRRLGNGGILIVPRLLRLPLHVFQLNERETQLFAILGENIARPLGEVWIVRKTFEVFDLLLNTSPEASDMSLSFLQLNCRRSQSVRDCRFRAVSA
jgi:hypothetical protein